MSSVTEPSDAAHPTTRMRSEERRELILEAATVVFGERGYVGATTDAVARAAGVSQPYVVRMFGTKEALFLEVLQRSLDKLIATFRAAIAGSVRAGDPVDALTHRIGNAYAEMLLDRGLLLSLMQSFLLGADPAIGAAARAGFLQVYRLLRDEAGFSAEQADEFLAHGMMMNTMVGLRMADQYSDDESARELLDAAMPHKLELLLNTRAETKLA